MLPITMSAFAAEATIVNTMTIQPIPFIFPSLALQVGKAVAQRLFPAKSIKVITPQTTPSLKPALAAPASATKTPVESASTVSTTTWTPTTTTSASAEPVKVAAPSDRKPTLIIPPESPDSSKAVFIFHDAASAKKAKPLARRVTFHPAAKGNLGSCFPLGKMRDAFDSNSIQHQLDAMEAEILNMPILPVTEEEIRRVWRIAPAVNPDRGFVDVSLSPVSPPAPEEVAAKIHNVGEQAGVMRPQAHYIMSYSIDD